MRFPRSAGGRTVLLTKTTGGITSRSVVSHMEGNNQDVILDVFRFYVVRQSGQSRNCVVCQDGSVGDPWDIFCSERDRVEIQGTRFFGSGIRWTSGDFSCKNWFGAVRRQTAKTTNTASSEVFLAGVGSNACFFFFFSFSGH